MKKKVYAVMAGLLALTSVLGACGEKGNGGVVIDPNKTQVYVSASRSSLPLR